MARDGWFDGKGFELFKKVRELRKKEVKEYWADGKITVSELEKQRKVIVDKLKKIEPKLNDDLHAEFTQVFIDWALLDEMTEYNRMNP